MSEGAIEVVGDRMELRTIPSKGGGNDANVNACLLISNSDHGEGKTFEMGVDCKKGALGAKDHLSVKRHLGAKGHLDARGH